MERRAYPSDLTDTQWRLIAPLIPEAKPGGRPRKYDMREVINGLLYIAREGCSWRALPHDLPHWKTCYNFFRRFEADGTWDDLLAALRVEVRTRLGREPTPSGACIDSQSAKTAHGGAEVGVDGGKMVRGRKRHIVTDTLGLLLIVVVTAANADDGTTAPRLLAGLTAVTFPRLAVVWADTKYRNKALEAWLAGQSRLRGGGAGGPVAAAGGGDVEAGGEEGVRPAAETLGRRADLRVPAAVAPAGARL